MRIATIAKKLAQAIGIDLRRYRRENTEAGQLRILFDRYGINTVLDVGANFGQYAAAIRQEGFSGRIISFEPLSAAHEKLRKNAARDNSWIVAPIAAIGSEEGEVDIHVAGNSASSSILAMLERHESAAPESRYVGVERVPLRRLDEIAPGFLSEISTVFLKIDTQGYEEQVLAGASKLLNKVIGVQLELSLAPLYDGQPQYQQMIQKMSDLGFYMRALWPGFRDPATGELLQFDAVFFRAPNASADPVGTIAN